VCNEKVNDQERIGRACRTWSTRSRTCTYVGDTVWARLTCRGTNSSAFGQPPTGRSIEITVMEVVRVKHGQVVEHWGVPDRFALLVQRGLLDNLLAGTRAGAAAH
jgi:hypothetical protein